ncbi:ankyrin repeat domain-containing protein [Aspergillus fischeri NRRL 181]|uniref:Ankyrin repeat protein n=1 Tax=Neosartorya fischeri (strain ATCC 1020 / DSM 3700 / CBS 544.65 / FGSC A1164 / JCM 1740 / NRRL 181 / WB 181) TaxID=331117 RepID=A1DAD4_NEOFI|nr:Ankyrin repeat protein [Aspergillus fischeri NRRL 181]EAW19824.1 Ankyrin repeat protein [Aspergillus fischeri NRRL 181]
MYMYLLDLPTEVLVIVTEALGKASDMNAFVRTSRTAYIRLNHVLYNFDVQRRGGKVLVWAAQKNNPHTAKKSLQAGIKSLNGWFQRPLMIMSRSGYTDMVRLLLDEGVDPETILYPGSQIATTALYIAASHGHDAIVQLLIEKGANVNLEKSLGQPLVVAVSHNRKTVVRILLEKGADPNARRYDNMPALCIAVTKGFTEIVEMLLDMGALTDLGGSWIRTPLQEAVRKNRFKITRLLLQKGAEANVGSQTYRDLPPLFMAVADGYERLLGLLLKHGANPNAWNSLPLHLAIIDNKIAMVRLLLAHGAEVNRKDSEGQTPLCYAIYQRYDHIVELLLLYDVDPDAETHDGITPLKLANHYNREDWVQKLSQKRDERKSSPP